MSTSKHNNIDDYISTFPAEVQKPLRQVREIIQKTAPEAIETISYSMPTFKLNDRYLIYFSAYKNHISVYPVPSGEKIFEKDFASYKTSGKGTIQFPLNQPMPLDLVAKIVRYRIKENNSKKK